MGGSVFLFPGHGTQRVGMGRGLYDNQTSFRSLIDSLAMLEGDPFGKAIAFLLANGEPGNVSPVSGPEGIDELTSQQAVYLVNAGYDLALKEQAIQPSFAYGYSSGVYSAVACCGAISVYDGLRLTTWAWESMIAAGDGRETGMIAVTGLRHEQIVSLLKEQIVAGEVSIANINSERQVYLSGYLDSLTEAMLVLRRPGLLNIQWLPVTIPYHSPLIAGASVFFAERILSIAVSDALFPLIDGCTGQLIGSCDNIRSMLCSQLVQPVNVPLCCDRLDHLQLEAMWEVGEGTFLQRLFRFNRRLPDIVSAKNLVCPVSMM